MSSSVSPAELRRQGRRPTGGELLFVNGRVELVGRSDDVRERLTGAGTTVAYDTAEALNESSFRVRRTHSRPS